MTVIVPEWKVWSRQPSNQLRVLPQYAPYFNSLNVYNGSPNYEPNPLLNRTDNFTQVGSVSTVNTLNGVGTKGDGTTGYLTRTLSPGITPKPGFIFASFVADSTTAGTVYSLGSSAASLGAYFTLGAASGYLVSVQMRWQDGGASLEMLNKQAVPINGVISVVAVVPDGSMATAYMYINGKKYPGATSNNLTAATANAYVYENINALKRGTVSNFGNTTVLATGYGFNSIPEDIAQQISNNPWQLFAPRKTLFYFPGVSSPTFGFERRVWSRQPNNIAYVLNPAFVPAAVWHGGGSMNDLVSGQAPTIVQDTTLNSPSAYGLATYLNSPAITFNNRIRLSANTNAVSIGSENFTAMVMFQALGRPDGGTYRIPGISRWNIATTPGSNEWLLVFDGSSPKPIMEVEVGSTVYIATATSPALVNGEWYVLMGVRNGTTISVFCKRIKTNEIGTASTTNAGITTVNTGKSSPTMLGQVSGSSIVENLQVPIAATFKYALTNQEVYTLLENPWQIFAPRRQLLYASAASVQLSYLRPASDITTGSWSPSTGTTLYGVLDEVTADDADYIQASTATGCEIKLSAGSTPTSRDNHTIKYRLLAGSGNIAVVLKCGSTTIKSWNHTLTGSAQDFSQALSNAEATTITDYSDLRVTFTSS